MTFDASDIGELALRLGLVSADQVRECLIELDDKKAPGINMIRLLERKSYLSPWQGGKLMKGDTDGYILGGFRLLYKIASGSFGRVYRSDDPRTGQIVAVKVLRNKWTADKQKVDLFMREGKLGMTIRHPNIVSVLAVNQDTKTGQYFIVMEFVEGGNLRDILTIRKKLEVEESLRIMEECAAGLAYSNSRGLTHRDIKPTNILLAAAGMAKLVDFGLAEISTSSQMHLERKVSADDVAVDRTVDYAGLEKATNQKAGDVRSDIYFLGCVLYECLTGFPLMPATKDRQAKMMARRYQDVEDTLAKNGPDHGIPPELMKVLGKMVAFEPRERYQTPQQLVEAIQHCRAELGGGAGVTVTRVPVGAKTLFAVEENEKLQNAFREKFKEHGYRVLISIDPTQALKRYQQQPYHALIIDAGTVGKEGVQGFNRVVREADSMNLDVCAVLILNEDQLEWAGQANEHKNAAVMVRPITMKKLLEQVYKLTPGHADELPE